MAKRYSVRRETGAAIGDWKTVFQGSRDETRDYLRAIYTNPEASHRAGVFRLYGGEGATRAKIGVRAAKVEGLFAAPARP